MRLTPSPEPPPPIAAGFVGRLLTDKGVPTLVEAHNLLARRGRPVALYRRRLSQTPGPH